MKYYIILTILLTACGSEDSSDPAVTTQTLGNPNPYTMSLDKKSDLPECDDSNLNQLAYVKSEDQFYECDGEWTAINIKGGKGRDGEDGEDYTNNDLRYWTDPFTGYEWHLAGTKNYYDHQCLDGFELPADYNEAKEAADNGLWLHFADTSSASPTSMWTNETAGLTSGYRLDSLDTTPVKDGEAFANPSGVYCVDKG